MGFLFCFVLGVFCITQGRIQKVKFVTPSCYTNTHTHATITHVSEQVFTQETILLN